MDDAVRSALGVDELIDITTTGRSSGQPRRIEIWFHVIDDAVYLSSMPGKRSWNANLVANPGFTFHFKQSLVRDVAARATAITDPAIKRDVFAKMKNAESRMAHMDIDVWVAESPLVLVEFTD
jgi:deazaflavin-dependent oxidoreductase (nitroreductase family)